MRSLLRKIFFPWRALPALQRDVQGLQESLRHLKEATGRIEARQSAALSSMAIADHEFQVYSQGGQDGILQFLIRHVPVARTAFVEFGAQDYREANTRFLLVNNRWSGLLMEADAGAVARIQADPVYWQFQLQVARTFVTRENINETLSAHGMTGDIGVLSIDVDGNDYWIWERVDAARPAIVVIEYNHRFGPERAVTVPYDPSFDRAKAHSSMIYYGASLEALVRLGRRKGYAFVGCNRLGNDAFFVRKDLKPAALRELSAAEGYVACSCRESRDAAGALAYLTPDQEKSILASLPLVDVEPPHP